MSAKLPACVTPILEPGSVVQLRSGGFSMTIEAVEGRIATCVWAGKDGRIKREQLGTDVLKRSTEGTDLILVVPGLDTSGLDQTSWGEH